MTGEKKVRTRVAPSPTGNAHVGTARSALINYAFARKHGGSFILRIDDTDLKRSTSESEAGVFEALHWLGLEWDEGPDTGGEFGPYKQSEKIERYKALAVDLIARGMAYRCFCSMEEIEALRRKKVEEGHAAVLGCRCRQLDENSAAARVSAGELHSIRIKVTPGEIVSFADLIYGPGERNAEDIGDFVIIKSDGYPVYHFASAVDEHDMEISHVIRAGEHYENTFKQLLIFRALGFEPPEFAHVPLLLNSKKAKISKRDGAVYIGEYRDMGYLPEAIVNFLALLGWSPPDANEIFSLQKYSDMVEIERFSKTNSIFETDKLDFLNGHYIREKSPEELLPLLLPFMEALGWAAPGSAADPRLLKITSLVRERLVKLSDVSEKAALFFSDDAPDVGLLMSNKHTKQLDSPTIAGILRDFEGMLRGVAEWTPEAMETALMPYFEQGKFKKQALLMALRTAALGTPVSPPLFESMEVLGRDKCLKNISVSIELLEKG